VFYTLFYTLFFLVCQEFFYRRFGGLPQQAQNKAIDYAGGHTENYHRACYYEHLGRGAGDIALCECQVRDKNFIRRLCNLGYCTTTE
jgi:hypothetical protein